MDIVQPVIPWLLLITGLFFGSLANVVIYRLPLMMGVRDSGDERSVNLWWPPSHCPHCKAAVKPRDNIPVISWVLLKGRCRQCSQPVSFIYPLSEALTGLAWFTLAILFPNAEQRYLLLGLCGLFTVFYILAVLDCKFLILPDSLVFMAMWGGLLLSAADKVHVRLEDAIYGVVLAWLLLWGVTLIWFKWRNYHGLGQGDVKLYAACSAWLGWEQIPLLLFSSAMAGVLFWIVVRFVARKSDTDETDGSRFYIPFGPSIVVMAFILIAIMAYQR